MKLDELKRGLRGGCTLCYGKKQLKNSYDELYDCPDCVPRVERTLLPGYQWCSTCGGSGQAIFHPEADPRRCPDCSGSGQVKPRQLSAFEREIHGDWSEPSNQMFKGLPTATAPGMPSGTVINMASGAVWGKADIAPEFPKNGAQFFFKSEAELRRFATALKGLPGAPVGIKAQVRPATRDGHAGFELCLEGEKGPEDSPVTFPSEREFLAAYTNDTWEDLEDDGD